jgi:hypothetical protein
LKRKVVLGAVLIVVAVLATFVPGFNAAQAATSVPGAPQLTTSFPVIGAAGVKWEPPSANLDSPPGSYVVMRQRPNGHWEEVSGPIDPSIHHWIDTTLQPGESHQYYVVAMNEVGTSQTSEIITATRPMQDPVTGSVNVLTIDVNPAFDRSPLTNEVATSVSASQPDGDTRTLSAGDIQVTIPALLPGRGGHVPVLRLRQGNVDCGVPNYATLTITQLAYTVDLQIALMTGWFSFRPCGASNGDVVGEIRVNSTEPYSAISVSSYSLDFGRVRVGTTAERPITITNVGTTDLTISRTERTEGDSNRWGVRDDCSAPLPPASSCTMTITFNATTTYKLDAWFRIYDSTRQEYRHIKAVAAGESPPSAPDSVKAAATLTGVDLSWTGPSNDGSRPVQGFVVRRYVDNTTTEYQLPADRHRWTDPILTAGAFYSVSAVNELGEGQRSFPIEPEPSREQIAVFSGPTGEDSTLGAVAFWGGTQVVPIDPDAPSSSRAELAVSPDGRSVAYTTAEGDNSVLWTRRADGPGSHPVTRVVTAAAIHAPTWSPDGTRIAYSTKDGTASCVDIVPTTGGTPVRVGCSLDFPVWHPDAQSLIVRDSRISGAPLTRLAARANGSRLAVVSGADGATLVAASPDGRWLAFVPAGQPNRVGIMPLTGGTARLSAELPSSSIVRVSWRPDAKLLGVLSRQSGVDRIHAVPVSAGVPDTPTLLLEPASDQTIHDLQWQGLAILIKPMPGVTGPSPSISFDTSALHTGSAITCQIDERAPVSCVSPYRPTGLTSGPHTLRVIAQEPDGETMPGRKVVAARAFTVDATAPTARIVAPTFGTTVASSATVAYTAKDSSGVASYDVRYRTASSAGAIGNYVYPKTGTTGISYLLALASGYEYCVSVRARDIFGNTSAWTAERCFSRPLDDRSLAVSTGWVRGTAAGLYYSTATSTTGYDASLTRTVKMKRAYLLATKCSTCGVVAVYLGTRYLTTINLYAATTQRQVLIGIPAQTSAISGTLRIATRSTGKLVQIDGVAIRQT